MTRKILAATVPPLVAFALEAAFWSTLTSFTWVLFYPAVFLSSWLGGFASGIAATILSAGIAAWYFLEPAGSLAIEPSYIPSTVVFIVMGFAFAWVHDRLTRTIAVSNQVAKERRIFMALVESSSDFIGIADPDGKPIYLNPAGRRMVGLAPDFPVQQVEMRDCYPPEIRPFVDDVILKTMRERGQWSGETVFRHWQTEASIPVSDDHFLIHDATGAQVLGMGTVTRDISEARRVMEKLRESEERFRLAIEEAPIGMALIALDGSFMRVNRVLCEIVGYSAEELSKLTFQDITHPDDLDVDVALATRLARGEIPRYQLEKRYIRKDRTVVDIMLAGSILRDPAGKPLHYIAQVVDITERKRAEAALKDSEQRLALALEAARMGTWDVELATDTVVRSLRHAQIFGYADRAGTWGLTQFLDHVIPDDRETARRTIEEALKSESLALECRIRREDQEVRWVSIRGHAYKNQEGVPVRLLGTIVDITERKRGEDALAASEREFRSLAESMPQIVWATTANGSNTYLNQQWADYTGLTLEESHGEGWIIPFHPDDRERAWTAWRRAIESREKYALECRLRRSDGVYRWWLIRGVPLLDENDEILKWFGTCTDIEDIKIAQQKREESEAKYSGIISISADAIISIDSDQRITIFNQGAQRIFGYTQAEAVGMPLERLLPDRLRSAHRHHIERFASGEVVARRMGERVTAIEGLRKNGETFPAEAAISRLLVGDKTLLTVALRDITERKRAEMEHAFLAEVGTVLSKSLDYEETLAAVARLAVRDFADWCVVEIIEDDEKVRRFKVVSADPTKAELCEVLEHVPIDRARPYFLRSVIETKQPLVIERMSPESLAADVQGPEHLEALRAVNPSSMMAFPLLRHDRLFGVLAFIASGRHYAASDVRLGEALADRAVVALENARLYRAAVDAIQLRDQVLGYVAHDLRNPLSAILLQASLLQSRGAQPERRSGRPGDAIKRAATRMNRLIQDILDVTRMEGGSLTVERKRVATAPLVADAVEAQRPLAASASLELQVDVEADISDTWADRERILQVLENLIGNAVKFTRAGGRIVVSAASQDGEVVFCVKDTGGGIAREDLPHVFDRFWQARKTHRGGAGLGLQIVKGIVEAHGGRVRIESELDVGTSFYFTLPTAQAAGAHPTPAEMH